MNKTISACLLSLAALAPLAADAAPPLVSFEGGIGSQPLRAGGLVNDVFTIPPGGRPWVISRLSADVQTDGGIRVDGRGLVLAGGNGIGTPGGQSVRARLLCNAGASSHDTGLVALDPRGDFRIEDALAPPPPPACNSPVLLILSSGGSWFAAGIPR